MPKPVGERIAIWSREDIMTEEGLDFGYVEHGELYITCAGPVERFGLTYHPAGAPNYPAILVDDVRPIDRIEVDGLKVKYNLSAEQMSQILKSINS